MPDNIELILVPTDFSLLSCEAFSWASFMANKFKAKIVLQHVVPERTAIAMESSPGNPWLHVLEQEDRALVQHFETCTADGFGRTEYETQISIGDAADKIVQAAKDYEAGLIVMCTHGRTGLKHLVMGSVAGKVIQHAPCPVLTVRPGNFRPHNEKK